MTNLFKVAGAHEYHYNFDFLLTVFFYLSAGQKLQTRTAHSFYNKLTVCEVFLAIKRTAALVHDRQRDGGYCTTLLERPWSCDATDRHRAFSYYRHDDQVCFFRYSIPKRVKLANAYAHAGL